MGCSGLWTLRERSLLLETSLSWAVLDPSLLASSLILWLWLLRLTVFLQPPPRVPSFPPPFFLSVSPPFPSSFIVFSWLGLHCCALALSSCSEWGPLFIAVHGLPIAMASLISEHRLKVSEFSRAQRLQHVGLVAPWHVRSFWPRGQTHVPCIDRWINHWTTREAPRPLFSLNTLILSDLTAPEISSHHLCTKVCQSDTGCQSILVCQLRSCAIAEKVKEETRGLTMMVLCKDRGGHGCTLAFTLCIMVPLQEQRKA